MEAANRTPKAAEDVSVSDLPSADPSAEEAERVKGGATVSGGVLNGKAISKPQPSYPAI